MVEPTLQQVGEVTGFFVKPSVAVVELSAPLTVGDAIYVKGHTTDFQQPVESMEVDRAVVTTARPGHSVGVKVQARCRKHDIVYKLGA